MRSQNSRRVFFDTNILLDAVCRERPGSAAARAALRRCNGGGDMGLVAPMSLKDAYCVLTKAYGEPAAREAVRKLMGLLVVAPLGAEECIMSIDSNEPDFEDGLIRACAELNDTSFILTRDAAAYQKCPIRSLTCDEYLEA